jgi:hypothetical protein
VPLVDRRDLRVVLNRFLLFDYGMIFSADLATKPQRWKRHDHDRAGRPGDTMTVRVRFPQGLEVSADLVVPGAGPSNPVEMAVGSRTESPGAGCLRVLAAEGTDDAASYSLWLWPQPPGLFEIELDWKAGRLHHSTVIDLPWLESMWGPTVMT